MAGDSVDGYPAVEDHGLIGDLQTAALVARTDGRLVLLPRASTRRASSARCWTRRRAATSGSRRTASTTPRKQLYLPGHRDPDHPIHDAGRRGRGDRLHADRPAPAATDRHRLVRLVRVVRGTMRFERRCQPRFDYGRDDARASRSTTDGAVFRSPTLTLNVAATRHGDRLADRGRSATTATVRVSRACSAGDIGGIVLETAPTRRRALRGDGDRANCSTRPATTGAGGSAGPRTRAAGARWSSARR